MSCKTGGAYLFFEKVRSKNKKTKTQETREQTYLIVCPLFLHLLILSYFLKNSKKTRQKKIIKNNYKTVYYLYTLF